MKKKSTSKSAFFNLRVLLASVLCLFGVFVALLGSGAFSDLFAQPKGTTQSGITGRQDAPGTQTPDVVQLIGPARLDRDVRELPYVPPKPPVVHEVLMRHQHPETEKTNARAGYGTSGLAYVQQLLKNLWRPAPTMPGPVLTFEGMSRTDTGDGWPPDTDGDVGPNHYIEALNDAFRIFDKSGNPLTPVTQFDSFFAPLGTGTPCGNNQTGGDPFVFYDHVADRWVLTVLAFPGFPGPGPYHECIAVSQTSDPVSGGWFFYDLVNDPSSALDDYPKFALWNNPQPGGAYFLTVNSFDGVSAAFLGVRVFALDRAAMLAGMENPTVVAFNIAPAGLGDSYSLLPANFRTGDPPPAGEDEFLLAIDSPFSGGVTLTQVKGWLFHVDFVTPANSTLGIGADHSPNALITVNGFIDAFDASFNTDLVPQQGTSQKLDTVGDRLFTPMVYQNLSGTESLWASHLNFLNYPSGPTAVRWYQFDVTGGNFPASATQQQDWSNNNDGLWRFFPSIAVDQSGNTAIGYAISSASIFPGIAYAGRLVTDPPGDLAQGEAFMTNGVGAQTAIDRWGDYTYTSIDPSDGMSFWHVGEYYQVTGTTWNTRIGKFNFQGGGASPTPTATATPAPRATPTPRPRPTAPAPRP
jgi:hypothetical protein